MRNNIPGLFLIALFSVACTSSPEEVKFQRYRVAGERLYATHCVACHMADGSGFKKLYPPLTGHDFLIEQFEKTLCTIRFGSNDSLTINNVQYTLPMPDLKLTNLETAEIATFLYNSWGLERGLIGVNEVAEITKRCE